MFNDKTIVDLHLCEIFESKKFKKYITTLPDLRISLDRENTGKSLIDSYCTFKTNLKNEADFISLFSISLASIIKENQSPWS